MLCPICDRDNPVDARRCKTCGADFEDPDIASQLDRPATAVDEDEPNLQGDRYLTLRWIGLLHGGDLRRVAVIGGVLFAIAALLPVNLDFHGVRAVWSVLGRGPTLALVVPLVCAALGIALATPLARGIPPVVIAGILAAGGAAILVLAIAPLGHACAMPERVPYLEWLGLGLSGAAISVRVLRPRDPNARWFAVAGAVLVLVGQAIPVTDARTSLPGEFVLYMRGQSLIDKSVLGAYVDGFDQDMMVKFLALWHLLAIALSAAAALLCLPTPSGPWDSVGLALRPLGWVVVFFLPLTMLFSTLNIMGWKGYDWVEWQGHTYAWDAFVNALFAGRARLVVLALPAAMWMVTGLVGLRVGLMPEAAGGVVPKPPEPPAPPVLPALKS